MLSCLLFHMACALSIGVCDASASTGVGELPILVLDVEKNDYDHKGNLVVNFQCQCRPAIAGVNLQSRFYYDERDWKYDVLSRTIWLRAPGKAPVKVEEQRALIDTMKLQSRKFFKVLRPRDLVSGYVKIDGRGFQKAVKKLGARSGERIEFMLTLNLNVSSEPPWILESTKDGLAISVLGESGQWTSRLLDPEKMRVALLSIRELDLSENAQHNHKYEETKNKEKIQMDFCIKATCHWTKLGPKNGANPHSSQLRKTKSRKLTIMRPDATQAGRTAGEADTAICSPAAPCRPRRDFGPRFRRGCCRNDRSSSAASSDRPEPARR